MSTVRRYTAGDFSESARMLDRVGYAEFAKEMRQAAETEARVMGLVEALQGMIGCYRCGNDLNLVMDEAEVALSKFRGEDA